MIASNVVMTAVLNAMPWRAPIPGWRKLRTIASLRFRDPKADLTAVSSGACRIRPVCNLLAGGFVSELGDLLHALPIQHPHAVELEDDAPVRISVRHPLEDEGADASRPAHDREEAGDLRLAGFASPQHLSENRRPHEAVCVGQVLRERVQGRDVDGELY